MDFHAHVQAFMGHVPRIADTVWLHASAQVIGRVAIERNSSVWCGAVLRGDVNTIRIGERSNIQDNSVLHVSHPTLSDPDGAHLIVGNTKHVVPPTLRISPRSSLPSQHLPLNEVAFPRRISLRLPHG